MSVINAINAQLKHAERELNITVFAISMAWTLGFLIPVVTMLS